MRRYITVIAIASSVLGFAACNQLTKKDTKAAKPKGKYYCTMHPEVTSDKPGTCSKCGMDLVERDTTEK